MSWLKSTEAMQVIQQPKKAKNKVMAFTYSIMSQMIGFLPLKSLNKDTNSYSGYKFTLLKFCCLAP
jgi:hypothetical protein